MRLTIILILLLLTKASVESSNDEGVFLFDLGKNLLKGNLSQEDQETLQVFGQAIVKGKVIDKNHKETFKLAGEAIISGTITEEAKKFLGKVLVNGKNTNEKTFKLLRNALDKVQAKDKSVDKQGKFEKQNVNTSDGTNLKQTNKTSKHLRHRPNVTKPKLIEHKGIAYLAFPELNSFNHENDEIYPEEYERPRAFNPAYVQYNPKQFLTGNTFKAKQQNIDIDEKSLLTGKYTKKTLLEQFPFQSKVHDIDQNIDN